MCWVTSVCSHTIITWMVIYHNIFPRVQYSSLLMPIRENERGRPRCPRQNIKWSEVITINMVVIVMYTWNTMWYLSSLRTNPRTFSNIFIWPTTKKIKTKRLGFWILLNECYNSTKNIYFLKIINDIKEPISITQFWTYIDLLELKL